MPQVLVDTSVLYAAAYPRDRSHDDALPILHGINDGTLPEGTILEFVLAETLNGLTRKAGHAIAVDFLNRIEANERFEIESLTAAQFATAKRLFRQYQRLSFVDASIVALAQASGVEYLYAFDDDFDGIEGLTRLATARNPYDPT
jgi:predicted nucleic acid-binding protein